MDNAEMLLNGQWIDVLLDEFSHLIKGHELNTTTSPRLRCVHCHGEASISGLASPTPRFRHNALPVGEDCPPWFKQSAI